MSRTYICLVLRAKAKDKNGLRLYPNPVSEPEQRPALPADCSCQLVLPTAPADCASSAEAVKANVRAIR